LDAEAEGAVTTKVEPPEEEVITEGAEGVEEVDETAVCKGVVILKLMSFT